MIVERYVTILNHTNMNHGQIYDLYLRSLEICTGMKVRNVWLNPTSLTHLPPMHFPASIMLSNAYNACKQSSPLDCFVSFHGSPRPSFTAFATWLVLGRFSDANYWLSFLTFSMQTAQALTSVSLIAIYV